MSTVHPRWDGTGSPMYESKFCRRCQQQRPVGDFARRSKDSTARQSWCRDCINTTRREAYAAKRGARRG